MKTIAYICTYNNIENLYKEDISKQTALVKNFCSQHQLNLDEIYVETSVREDFKPVLLDIMSKSFNTVEKVIIPNFEVLSTNKDFKDWVLDEFKRMKIEVICISQNKSEDDLSQDKKISNVTDSIKNLPSLPEIITKSIELMQNPNTSAHTLSKIISNDIGLTARVLKLVNSSYYGFSKQISTIQQAITILGFTTIKGIILSASIYKMFSAEGVGSEFNYKLFWKHSILVAFASKLLAEYLKMNTKEDIFSAAFLHDIGKIIFAQYDKKNYIYVCLSDYENDYEYMKAEEQYCGLNHCELGNMVAYSWNLPEIFCDVITYHHKPAGSKNFGNECSIVYIANIIAKSVESNKKLNIDNIPLDLLENLKISVDNIVIVYEKLCEMSDDFNNINSFFE